MSDPIVVRGKTALALRSEEYFAVVPQFQAGSSAAYNAAAGGGGAIGRRDGLKSHCPSGRVGSSPTRRIKPSITAAPPQPSGYD
jgi:hypothetical protein